MHGNSILRRRRTGEGEGGSRDKARCRLENASTKNKNTDTGRMKKRLIKKVLGGGGGGGGGNTLGAKMPNTKRGPGGGGGGEKKLREQIVFSTQLSSLPHYNLPCQLNVQTECAAIDKTEESLEVSEPTPLEFPLESTPRHLLHRHAKKSIAVW